MKYSSVIIHRFSILKTGMLALNPRLPLAKSVDQSALLPRPCVSWASLSPPSLTSCLSGKRCTVHDIAHPVMWLTLWCTRRNKLSGDSGWSVFLISADRVFILMMWSAFCRSSISSVSTSRRHKCTSAKHMFSWCIFKEHILRGHTKLSISGQRCLS